MQISREIGAPIHGLASILPCGQKHIRLLDAYFSGYLHWETHAVQDHKATGDNITALLFTSLEGRVEMI